MSRDAQQLARQYDQGMGNRLLNEYYGNSGFFNYGYWTQETPDQAAACAGLTEKLLDAIPDKRGTILDVACGLGATTRHLLRHYPAQAVMGVNLSGHQLQVCKEQSSDIAFVQMDAACLAFDANTFDNVISVEAAFHFDTRERFLREAVRILQPGGILTMSDILFIGVPGKRKRRLPIENFVTDLDIYRTQFRQAGFADVDVVDATRECWVGFRNNLMRWGWDKLQIGAMDRRTWFKHMLRLAIGSVAIRKYVLVRAFKAA